jgi:hypothetical protein
MINGFNRFVTESQEEGDPVWIGRDDLQETDDIGLAEEIDEFVRMEMMAPGELVDSDLVEEAFADFVKNHVEVDWCVFPDGTITVWMEIDGPPWTFTWIEGYGDASEEMIAEEPEEYFKGTIGYDPPLDDETTGETKLPLYLSTAVRSFFLQDEEDDAQLRKELLLLGQEKGYLGQKARSHPKYPQWAADWIDPTSSDK